MSQGYTQLIQNALSLTDGNTTRAKGLVSYIDQCVDNNVELTQMIFEFAQSNTSQTLTQSLSGNQVTFYSLANKGEKIKLYHPNRVQSVQVIQGALSATFDLRAGEVIPIPPGRVFVLENKTEVPVKAWSFLQKTKTY